MPGRRPTSSAMAPLQFMGARPNQRARVNPDESIYLYDAGESDGSASFEYIAGWGSVVRSTSPPRFAQVPSNTFLALYAQNRLTGVAGRLRDRPERGTLSPGMVESVPVPALSSIGAENVVYWGNRDTVMEDSAARKVWRDVARSSLPNQIVAMLSPRERNSKSQWEAHTQVCAVCVCVRTGVCTCPAGVRVCTCALVSVRMFVRACRARACCCARVCSCLCACVCVRASAPCCPNH